MQAKIERNDGALPPKDGTQSESEQAEPKCPITLSIYRHPVKLIVKNNQDWRVGTATVEKEAWDTMLSLNPLAESKCPLTTLPVRGYIRNIDMENIVRRYLEIYPTKKEAQYHQYDGTLTNPSNILNINEALDVETGLNNVVPTIGENLDTPVSRLELAQAFILSCWTLEYCRTVDWCSIIGFSILIGGTLAALGALESSIGAAIVKCDIQSAVQASALGFPLIFGAYLAPKLSSDINCERKMYNALLRLPSCSSPREPFSWNITSVFGVITFLTCLGITASIIGQLILHGDSDDHISLPELAKASALGMTLFSTAIVTRDIYYYDPDHDNSNPTRGY